MRRSLGKMARLGFDTVALGFDAAAVIGLRTMKISQGGAAGAAEAELMVSEKIEGAAQLQWQLMTGGLGLSPMAVSKSTVSKLSKTVRANRKRLGKKGK